MLSSVGSQDALYVISREALYQNEVGNKKDDSEVTKIYMHMDIPNLQLTIV